MENEKEKSKATKEELDERVEYTYFLLCRRLYKGDIKKLLKRKYSIGARTCENYISRAREILLKDTGKTRDQNRTDSLLFYESILAGPDSHLRDRIYAQERLDKLLGLEAPQLHDVTAHGDYIMEVVEVVVAKKDYKNDKEASNDRDAPKPEGISGK